MLAQRLRRWPNIKTSLFQRVVLVEFSVITGDSVEWPGMAQSA